MIQYCIASQCPGNCCNYYAQCSYPTIAEACYTTSSYYYYDYWWVYTLVSFFIFCAILSAICVARRRRLQRMNRANDTILINNDSPSYTMGQPVYPQA